MNALNEQIGGNHYKDFSIQPVEFIHKNNIGFIEGCIIKYICRYKAKGGVEDLEKVKHYTELLIELSNTEIIEDNIITCCKQYHSYVVAHPFVGYSEEDKRYLEKIYHKQCLCDCHPNVNEKNLDFETRLHQKCAKIFKETLYTDNIKRYDSEWCDACRVNLLHVLECNCECHKNNKEELREKIPVRKESWCYCTLLSGHITKDCKCECHKGCENCIYHGYHTEGECTCECHHEIKDD
jgi:hypothetical protein